MNMENATSCLSESAPRSRERSPRAEEGLPRASSSQVGLEYNLEEDPALGLLGKLRGTRKFWYSCREGTARKLAESLQAEDPRLGRFRLSEAEQSGLERSGAFAKDLPVGLDLRELLLAAKVQAEARRGLAVEFLGFGQRGPRVRLYFERLEPLFEDPRFVESQLKGRFERCVCVGLQMAAALEELHRVGVLHRDVKPRNFGFDRKGRVKVFDFGCAFDVSVRERQSARERRGPFDKEPTTKNESNGFQSPEQIEDRRFERATDVWALGMTLHCLFWGRRLFVARPGANPLADLKAAVRRFKKRPCGPEKEARLRKVLSACLRWKGCRRAKVFQLKERLLEELRWATGQKDCKRRIHASVAELVREWRARPNPL